MRHLCLTLALLSAGRAPAAAPELVLQTGHSSVVEHVSATPDGRLVLSAARNGQAVLWDGTTGQQLLSLWPKEASPVGVGLTPDGSAALWASYDGASVWDIATGRKLREFAPGDWAEGRWHSAVLSPDGTRVAFAVGVIPETDQCGADIYELETGKRLHRLRGHRSSVYSVAWSDDGSRLLAGGWDNSASLWDARTGERLRTIALTSGAGPVALSNDGETVAVARKEGYGKPPVPAGVSLYDAQTGAERVALEGVKPNEWVKAVAFTADGKSLVMASSGGVRTWDTATGRTAGADLPDAGGPLGRVGPRRWLVSVGLGLALWEPGGAGVVREFRGASGKISVVRFSPDGRFLATACGRRHAEVWDLAAGRFDRTVGSHKEGVDEVRFAADGARVLTASFDNQATAWDRATGRRLADYGRGGRGLAVSADGTRVAVAFQPAVVFSPNFVTLTDVDGKLVRGLMDGTNRHELIAHVEMSADGKRVLSGHQTGLNFFGRGTGMAHLWDADTGRLVRSTGHSGGVRALAFSRDGSTIASAGEAGVTVWDADSGRVLREVEGADPACVGFTPDGKRVFVGQGSAVGFWDVSGGPRQKALQLGAGVVTAAECRPDGRVVAAGSSDGCARLWDIGTGAELARLISFDNGADWLVVTPEGLFDGSVGGRERVSFRVGGGLTIVPVDRFFQDFYRPGLLAAIHRGERPTPDADFAAQTPPAVRFAAPKENTLVSDESAEVTVEAEDKGGGVQGPTLYHNGTRLLTVSAAARDGKVTRRTFRVRLVEGQNRLEARASSGDGGWEAEPARIVLTYDRPPQRPDLWLLCVGIDTYADERMALKYAAADARAFAELFERRGAALYGTVHARTLIDAQATRAGLKAALAEVATKAQPRDTFALTVSGHGATLGQRYYLLPQDFRADAFPTRDEAIRRQGVPVDELGELVGKIAALRKVLVLDTCGSGGAAGLLQKGARGDPYAFRGAVERMNRAQGLFTIAACAAGEEAQEVPELGHGVLSYALLAGLRGVGGGPLGEKAVRPDSPEGVADVLEWFGFAAGQAPGLTRRYFGREQDVHMSTAGASFPVLPVRDR